MALGNRSRATVLAAGACAWLSLSWTLGCSSSDSGGTAASSGSSTGVTTSASTSTTSASTTTGTGGAGTGGGGAGGAGAGGGQAGGAGGSGGQGGEVPVEPISGLDLDAEVVVPSGPSGTPHLTKLIAGDPLLMADSFGGVMAYHVSAGSLTLAYQTELSVAGLRCTTIARHEPSGSVYCAAADVAGVAALDAATGALRTSPNFLHQYAQGFADLHVDGDALYLAAFDQGLQKRPIDANGALGASTTIAAGDVVGVESDGDTLVALDRDRGLVFFQDDVEVGTFELDGPTQNLSVHDGRAAVALGSKGAVVVDVASRTLIAEVHPPCVATSADAAPGGLAVGCLGGLYVYGDLAAPHVVAWRPTSYGVLDVRFAGDRLLATGWWMLSSYKLGGAGAIGLDVPMGYFLDPGGGVTFEVRNPGEAPQHLHGETIDGFATVPFTVQPVDEAKTFVDVLSDEGVAGLSNSRVKLRRGLNRPSLGGTFPIAAPGQYVTFVLPDCAIQWPALLDIAWLSAHGGLPGGRVPLVLGVGSDDEWGAGPFAKVWGGLEVHRLKELMPGGASQDIFDLNFSANGLIDGPDITSDFALDDANVVVGYDRVYRGAYPLQATPISPPGP